MDLNELFYRQQIERSKAATASSDEVRKIHEALAVAYEEQIAAAGRPDAGIIIHPRSVRDVSAEKPKANPTMVLAMTAREVGGR
jgi:hypothetical protein